MKPSHLILGIIAVIAVSGLAWWTSMRDSTPALVSYASQAECEQATGKRCSQVIAEGSGGSGYWLPAAEYQPSTGAIPIPGGSVDITVIPRNWQTYRNEEYGFEFQYPQGWQTCDLVQEERPWSLPHYRITARVGCLKSPERSSEFRGNVQVLLRLYSEAEWFVKYPTYESFKSYLEAEEERVRELRIGAVSSLREGTVEGARYIENRACDDGCWGTYFIYLPDSLISILYYEPDQEARSEIQSILSTFKSFEGN